MRTGSARLYRYTVLRNSAGIIGKVNQGRNSKVVPEGTFGGNFAREMVQVRWKSCWRQLPFVVGRRTSAKNADGGTKEKCWSRRPDLNWRPADYESAALPTELRPHHSDSRCGCGARKGCRRGLRSHR